MSTPEQLLAQLQQLQQAQQTQSGWGAPAAAPAQAQPVGVSIPLKMESGGQTIRVYLQFGPEYASPAALNQLLFALAQQGFPLDSYQPKQQSGWGNNGGNNGYNGGGGFRRGWGNR